VPITTWPADAYYESTAGMNGNAVLRGITNRSDGDFPAKSVDEIRLYIAQSSKSENSLTAQLDNLIASSRNLAWDLGRIDLLRAQVGYHANSTRSIKDSLLNDASSTASRISISVRRLDVEQARVKSTLDVVEDVAELKACILGLAGSMGAPQDWETAAGYLNRASKIPREIVHGSFAESTVPTAEVPDPPCVTLEQAAVSLCGLFLREFEKAAQEGHVGKVTRFFKLFPLIGKSEVGLDVYGRYVCQGVASRARATLGTAAGKPHQKEGLFYADALTKLFEHIAQIVEHHGGLVERHYGVGQMVMVVERLQCEADVQGGIILDTWGEERNIEHRITDIRSYAFTFLVQSFLPTPPARTSTPQAGPITDNQSRDDGSVDMKEIDGLISEIAIMLRRWSLYSSFIANKCRDSGSHEGTLKIPPLLLNSRLRQKIGERLLGPFNTMATFFFRRSVEKAFQLDEQPSDLSLDQRKPVLHNPPHISSAVDDVMYIVDQLIERSIATSERVVVSDFIPTVARVLGSDFIGMTQRKMRDECYPKALSQGTLPPEHNTIAFLVLINNLDVARDYITRIVQSRVKTSQDAHTTDCTEPNPPSYLASLFPLDEDAVAVSNTLKSLQSSFDAKAMELIGDGVFVVFKNVMKPRLRPILADAFRDVDYHMTQEELDEATAATEAEGRDDDYPGTEVSDRFQRGWDLLTKPVSRLLTERNFEKLLELIISYLGEVLEKRIWSYYGRLDALGAGRLERDIASVASIVVRDGKYRLRESFARCTQICMIMNMEDDEWEEMQQSSNATIYNGIGWELDPQEHARARAMVTKSK
ncbi:MAG: hypothetical protein Q9163_006374, partial [Psora crenata]